MYMLSKNDYPTLEQSLYQYQFIQISYFLSIFVNYHYLNFYMDNHDIHHFLVFISIFKIKIYKIIVTTVTLIIFSLSFQSIIMSNIIKIILIKI
jgi:hypothetical protein